MSCASSSGLRFHNGIMWGRNNAKTHPAAMRGVFLCYYPYRPRSGSRHNAQLLCCHLFECVFLFCQPHVTHEDPHGSNNGRDHHRHNDHHCDPIGHNVSHYFINQTDPAQRRTINNRLCSNFSSKPHYLRMLRQKLRPTWQSGPIRVSGSSKTSPIIWHHPSQTQVSSCPVDTLGSQMVENVRHLRAVGGPEPVIK